MSERRDEAYDNPLVTRYAGRAMRELFSARNRALVWRDLWIALAEAQRELGLDIGEGQLNELRAHRDDVDLEAVAAYERDLRHDVMAHVHHYGDQAPSARGILHLGATSCYVTDNADLWIQREALRLVEARLVEVLSRLREQAVRHRDLCCLGYTHFQPAQPTTLGKRITLWMQDFVLDLDEVRLRIAELPFRGAKGTTGTQASYLALFGGDHAKVRELDRRVAERMGFGRTVAVCGQTYPRKLDWTLLSTLSAVAQSAAKLGVDFRLLSHEGELSEPFTDKQIGSSAMAYKRNPMRTERVCSLARLVVELAGSAAHTASTQWLERTLDDSAIRRVTIPEAFLAVDAILMLVANVAAGMQAFPMMMRRHLDEHLPFLATEELLMRGVQAGGDRQDLHERIRVHAVEAGRRMKEEGVPNPLLDMLRADAAFAFARDGLDELCDPRRFIGRADAQVDEFLAEVVEPRIGAGVAPGADEVRV
ncbi:MAG: adenylosuccinate lyase [Planctomycetota bacterium]